MKILSHFRSLDLGPIENQIIEIKLSIRGYKYMSSWTDNSGKSSRSKKVIRDLKRSLKVCYRLTFNPLWNINSLYKYMSLCLKNFSRTINLLTIKENVPMHFGFPKMDSVKNVAFTRRSDLFYTSLTHGPSISLIRKALSFQKIKKIEFPLLNQDVVNLITKMKRLQKVILNTETSNLVKYLEKIAIFYVNKRFKIDVRPFESINYHLFLDGF